MKVAMIDPSLFTGRYDDSLCAALAQRGQDVTLHARTMRPTDAIVPRGYTYDPRFFPLGEAVGRIAGEGRAFRIVKGMEYLAAARLPLGQMARAEIAHVQWMPLPAADARLIARLHAHMPLVHTVHNAKPFHGDGAAKAQREGYDKLLGRFDALIVHVDATRQALLERGHDADRIHLVSHPPMRLATATADDIAAVQAMGGAPGAMPRILFFGTIRPYKGLDLLLEAALSLWCAGEEFELAIAGKPFVDMDALLEPIRAAGFADRLVMDLGFLTEGRLDAHLRRADILAFPYRHIDASGALLTALHYGKPVLVSDTGLFADLAARAEQPLLAAPPDDAAGLAASLLSLLRDAAMRRDFGERAVALDAILGSWDETAMATIAVYEAARRRWQQGQVR